MKKIIAMLLALVMVFSLCGCGNKELTDEEKEKIYYEVAEKKAKEAAEAMTEAPSPQSTLAPLYDVGPSPTDSDFLTIEEIKLMPVDNGRVKPDMKIRCLYPEGVLQLYPQSAEVFYNYLNNDGEIIASNSVVWHQLAYDICGWTRTNAFTVQHGDDSFDPDEVKTIMIMRYDMRTIIGGRVSWQNSWSFLSPVQFSVDKLEIE